MSITLWAVAPVALDDMEASTDLCFFSTQAGAHLYGKETFADRIYVVDFKGADSLPERIFIESDWEQPCLYNLQP